MSDYPITQPPQSSDSIFTLIPNEHIRFEYSYKPGCFSFSSQKTTVTNMRLITHITKTPTIWSKKTSTGQEKKKVIYLANVNSIKQIQAVIPSIKTKWWMKCIDVLTCTCSNEQIDWLETFRLTENKALDTTAQTVRSIKVRQTSFIEKF